MINESNISENRKLKDLIMEFIRRKGALGIRETQLFYQIAHSDTRYKYNPDIIGGATVMLNNIMKQLLEERQFYKLTINDRIVYYFENTCSIKLEVGS